MKTPKKGDRITFKAATRWGSCRPVTRTVKNIGLRGEVEVGYGGWTHFIVRREEITNVEVRKC